MTIIIIIIIIPWKPSTKTAKVKVFKTSILGSNTGPGKLSGSSAELRDFSKFRYFTRLHDSSLGTLFVVGIASQTWQNG